jgi:hypothetical protein
MPLGFPSINKGTIDVIEMKKKIEGSTNWLLAGIPFDE